jgi:hypothetical protein
MSSGWKTTGGGHNWCRRCFYDCNLNARHSYYLKHPYRPCSTPGCSNYAWCYESRCIRCRFEQGELSNRNHQIWRQQGWRPHHERIQQSFLTAYAMDNGRMTLPLFREYNLTDPRDRRSIGYAMNWRRNIKVKIRNRMINANYPYPWELEQDNV